MKYVLILQYQLESGSYTTVEKRTMLSWSAAHRRVPDAIPAPGQNGRWSSSRQSHARGLRGLPTKKSSKDIIGEGDDFYTVPVSKKRSAKIKEILSDPTGKDVSFTSLADRIYMQGNEIARLEKLNNNLKKELRHKDILTWQLRDEVSSEKKEKKRIREMYEKEVDRGREHEAASVQTINTIIDQEREQYEIEMGKYKDKMEKKIENLEKTMENMEEVWVRGCGALEDALRTGGANVFGGLGTGGPFEYKNEWTILAMKYSYIFREMKKVGAIREDHDWAEHMIEDMEILKTEDGVTTTVFDDVPISMRNEYLRLHLTSITAIDRALNVETGSETDVALRLQSETTDETETDLDPAELRTVQWNTPEGREVERKYMIILHVGIVDGYDGSLPNVIRVVQGIEQKLVKIQSVFRGFLCRKNQ